MSKNKTVDRTKKVAINPYILFDKKYIAELEKAKIIDTTLETYFKTSNIRKL
jgi:hypothetical protein